jgi:succinylglutamate desuccinylase
MTPAIEVGPPGDHDLPARTIGQARGATPGPLLLVLAGLHGNEPAGVEAAGRVVSALSGMTARLRGDIVALRGNRRALVAERRYVERDLNRGWSDSGLAALRSAPSRGPEDVEQIELDAALDRARADARGPVTFIDLHTTSAEGVPFAMVGDHDGPRAMALEVGLPVIEGLFGQIRGVLLEYLAAQGIAGIGFEGGQNERPESADNHEAVLWLLLVANDMLPEAEVPRLEEHRRRLGHVARGLPRLLRVHHRHGLWPADGFRMEPGFSNLQRVREGELLARDKHGEIRAPEEAVLLMPLYQALGDDGFFLGRELG